MIFKEKGLEKSGLRTELWQTLSLRSNGGNDAPWETEPWMKRKGKPR